MFYVLFCQKLVVCLVSNKNVLRDVTKFLTERVQMKQISTCIIINLKQASQYGESESTWKNVFKFCYVGNATHCACWYMHKPSAFLWWTISSSCQVTPTSFFYTKFLKVNVYEWNNAVKYFWMIFKIQKLSSSIEIVNEQEHLIQKLASPLCYEKIKLLL